MDLAGERLDAALARLIPEHSRSRLQTWIREGRILRDGTVALDPKSRLNGGERLDVYEAHMPQAVADAPENIPLEVVFEDEHLLVIDKPAGLVAHPGSGNWSGTLLNALLGHSAELANVPRAGIVHRLDKETSGLLVVAKTLTAQTDLVRQLQARTVKRHYAAIVMGVPHASGVVDAPIGRHPTHRTKMAVIASGRAARTQYKLVERLRDSAWVECSLETGRTHQIRVHMAHLGHPLIGDPVYGGRRVLKASVGNVVKDFPRQALHAFRLGLIHPASGLPMQWEVPLAEDILQLIDALRSVDDDR
ncbi:MAG TPA: 23S rRNA pseudouridine(1911/1915/1917) synthase RluD [Rhodocyclaceae bacterium]|nr:23S rRNA pseudouridine(1911/1915/1917) synthase RluD [Rhodocyclaceae bacterium]